MNLRKASRGRFGAFVIWVVVIGFGLGVLLLFIPNLSSSLNSTNQVQQKESAIVVNGDKISEADFDQALNATIDNYTRFYGQFGQDFTQRLQGADGAHYRLELSSQVVDQLTRQKLLEQEVRARKVKVSDVEVEAAAKVQLENILTQNKLTEQEADDRLRASGSSLRQFKANLKKQVSDQLEQDELKKTIVGDQTPNDEELIAFAKENASRYTSIVEAADPTDEDIQQYYDANQDKYLQVKAQHILVKVAQDAPEEEVQAAKAKIEDIKRRLDEGADFTELATNESDDAAAAAKGGDLGYFGAGQMVKPFEEVAFAMEPGQISDPVRTQFGFHIIKVEDKKVKPLDEVRSQIKDTLLKAKKDDALNALLDKASNGDKDALAKLHDKVESDYVTQKENDKFEEWVKGITDKATIEIKLPTVLAFRLEADNPDGALAAYEKIKQEGTSSDPYLDYYIGQLYQKRHSDSSAKLAKLQDKETLSPEEEQEVKSLTAEVESDREQAAKNLLSVAQGSSTRDLKLFGDVIDLGDDSPQVRYSYALAMLQDNDRSGAIAQLKKALEKDDSYAPAHTLYADLMVQQSNFEIAVEHYQKALDNTDPKNRSYSSIQLKLAQALLGDEQFKPSQALFETILAREEKNTSALTGLGDLYFAQEDYPNAEKYYKQSLAISPRADVRVKLGNTYLNTQQYDKATSEFEAAQKRDSYSIDSYRGLGEVLEAQGKNDKALEQYREGAKRARGYEQSRDINERILTLDPQDLKTRFKLANLYKTQHVFQRAIDHYNTILEQDPNSFAAYTGLAESYDGRAEYSTAKTYYQSALTVEGLSADDQIKTYESLLETEKKIVGFDNTPGPDGLDALFQLTKLYLDKGDTDKAKAKLAKLKSYDPTFRQDDAAQLQQQLDDFLANKPGKAVDVLEATHVTPGQDHAAYNSTPPTSGPHYANDADWGIHTAPVENELQVHNLEHGGIVIQYKPDLDADTVSQLLDLVRELGPTYKKLILAPYPGLDSAIALTAWGRIDKFERFNAGRIRDFVKAYVDQGPEKVGYDGSDWWTQNDQSGDNQAGG